jgi:hypothetical protein
MTLDPDAQLVTINYTGGYIQMPVGNAKSLFGDDPSVLRPAGVETSVSVKSHTRTRVIGGPTTPVAAYQYTYTQWPSKNGAQASGGEAIMMTWEGSEGSWTARMGGSAWELGTFLNERSPVAVSFQTAQGTNYGPFIQST